MGKWPRPFPAGTRAPPPPAAPPSITSTAQSPPARTHRLPRGAFAPGGGNFVPGSVCPAQRPKTRAGSALSTGRATRRARGALDTLQASPQVNSIKVPTSAATRAHPHLEPPRPQPRRPLTHSRGSPLKVPQDPARKVTLPPSRSPHSLAPLPRPSPRSPALLRRGGACTEQHPLPATPQSPGPRPEVSLRAGCGHRGWGLHCHRPLPRAGPPRRSRRRGRPVAPRTGAGLTFPSREEQEEEEGRRGKGFVSASRPPPAPALAIPLPQPPSGACEGWAGEPRGRGRRLRDPGPPPPLPGTAHPPPPGRAASALARGPGTRVAGRRAGPESLFNPERTWLALLPTRLGAADPLFSLPWEDGSFVFGDSARSPSYQLITEQRAPLTMTSPVAPLRTPNSRTVWGPQSGRRAWARPFVRGLEALLKPGRPGREVFCSPSLGSRPPRLVSACAGSPSPGPEGARAAMAGGGSGCGITPGEATRTGGEAGSCGPVPGQEPAVIFLLLAVPGELLSFPTSPLGKAPLGRNM